MPACEWYRTSALVLCHGPIMKECVAWMIDDIVGLAVTNPEVTLDVPDDDEHGPPAAAPGWTVTHLDSGHEIGVGCLTFGVALSVARALGELPIDWNGSTEEVVAQMQIGSDLREAMDFVLAELGTPLLNSTNTTKKPARKR